MTLINPSSLHEKKSEFLPSERARKLKTILTKYKPLEIKAVSMYFFFRENVSPALLQEQSIQKCHESKANQPKGSSRSNLGDVIDSNTEQPCTQLRTKSVTFLAETCLAS